jgi:hypothetical protein
MGKEPDRVERPHGEERPRDLQRLRTEIGGARRRLDAYVEELDRRRHRLLSVRDHPAAATAVGLAILGIVGGVVYLARRRAQARSRSWRRARHFRDAVSRMSRHPERVASDAKSPWSRVLVAIAPIVVKKLVDAAVRFEPRRKPKGATSSKAL